jgi:hypothetical protein
MALVPYAVDGVVHSVSQAKLDLLTERDQHLQGADPTAEQLVAARTDRFLRQRLLRQAVAKTVAAVETAERRAEVSLHVYAECLGTHEDVEAEREHLKQYLLDFALTRTGAQRSKDLLKLLGNAHLQLMQRRLRDGTSFTVAVADYAAFWFRKELRNLFSYASWPSTYVFDANGDASAYLVPEQGVMVADYELRWAQDTAVRAGEAGDTDAVAACAAVDEAALKALLSMEEYELRLWCFRFMAGQAEALVVRVREAAVASAQQLLAKEKLPDAGVLEKHRARLCKAGMKAAANAVTGNDDINSRLADDRAR